jgi:hypothetical protein
MKITVINKGSNRKPTGYCAEMIDEPPMTKKA